MLKIESRKWVAVVYQCPVCGARSGETMLTPYQWKHHKTHQCWGYKCDNAPLKVAQYKWYTTFAIEPSLSGTTIAGTLAEIGPFRVCQIVHPNIRVFRSWYWRRKREEAEKLKAYLERERQIDAEYRSRLERQRQEAALITEAEKVARAAWSGENQIVSQVNDFDPFLDCEE